MQEPSKIKIAVKEVLRNLAFYCIFPTWGCKTAVEIHQLVATIKRCYVGNSQAQQLQWLWLPISACLTVHWGYTFTLLFLRNAMGLISDPEGNTEVTSTSDLPPSKGPS